MKPVQSQMGIVKLRVRGQVRDRVRGRVWGRVWDQMYDQVADQVADQVRDRVRDIVWSPVLTHLTIKAIDQEFDMSGRLRVARRVWGKLESRVKVRVRFRVCWDVWVHVREVLSNRENPARYPVWECLWERFRPSIQENVHGEELASLQRGFEDARAGRVRVVDIATLRSAEAEAP